MARIEAYKTFFEVEFGIGKVGTRKLGIYPAKEQATHKLLNTTLEISRLCSCLQNVPSPSSLQHQSPCICSLALHSFFVAFKDTIHLRSHCTCTICSSPHRITKYCDRPTLILVVFQDHNQYQVAIRSETYVLQRLKFHWIERV
jgi:hypothetical protein